MEEITKKVIIAGGRDFTDYTKLKSVINTCPYSIEVVCGGANGADALGKRYALENNLVIHNFPADWNTYGKSAGYIRNKQMAEFSDVLVAFWNGSSKGTKHMIDLATKEDLTVIIIRY